VFDGSALEELVYRIVDHCPPRLEDFSSYEALGRQYDRRDFFRGTGISVYTTRERAETSARRYSRERDRVTRSPSRRRRLGRDRRERPHHSLGAAGAPAFRGASMLEP
jgi:hypothetical protein